ncbi:hypothetical protein BKA65DRAFT_549560 [Rhexocercosporidium sp. MPI-PUGE-AT-0058]|nr:hypothetical protein BKA65DRAFT_549560 [Rhexocercosporidium sp. MPI-PUGE-AT-0058]
MEAPLESNVSPRSQPSMHFIVFSNVEKVDPVTRKLIRSHVMRGKKQKKVRPQTPARRPLPAPIKLEDVVETCAAIIPGRVGSDLSFIEFADEVEPSLLLKMTKGRCPKCEVVRIKKRADGKTAVSPIAMQVIFPLMATIGFQPDPRGTFYPLVYDAATLHITAFAIDGFFSRILRRQSDGPSPAAMMHLRKGLKLLQERLLEEDDEKKISDSTIGVVLKLATTAHFDGECETSRQHMEGLRKMVDLRGGLKVFSGTKLAVEMIRCDLSIAVLHGSSAVLFCEPSEMEAYPERMLRDPDEKKSFRNSNELIQTLSADLAIAWKVMERFCMLVNLGAQTSRLLEPELIHQTMASVLYRLIPMTFTIGSLDETLRNGLLAYSYHVFLQWKDIRFSRHQFPLNYRKLILEPGTADKVPSRLMLWLLVIGANAFFKVADEVWLGDSLRKHARRCNVKSWKDMEGILKSIMWMPLLDDKAGREVFDLFRLNE